METLFQNINIVNQITYISFIIIMSFAVLIWLIVTIQSKMREWINSKRQPQIEDEDVKMIDALGNWGYSTMDAIHLLYQLAAEGIIIDENGLPKEISEIVEDMKKHS